MEHYYLPKVAILCQCTVYSVNCPPSKKCKQHSFFFFWFPYLNVLDKTIIKIREERKLYECKSKDREHEQNSVCMCVCVCVCVCVYEREISTCFLLPENPRSSLRNLILKFNLETG